MKAWKKELLKPWWNEYPDYLPLGAKYRGLWQKATVSRIIKELDERKLDMEVATKVFGHKVEIIEVTEYYEYGGQAEHPQLGYKIQNLENPEFVAVCRKEDPNFPDYYTEEIELPHYSTDIKDAWTILRADKLSLDSFKLYFSTQHIPFIQVHLEYNNNTYVEEGKTESEAICLAALKAVEHENK